MRYLSGAMVKPEHTKTDVKKMPVDVYKDTLGDDRRRKRPTVDKIPEITGRNKDYSQETSTSVMDNVFKDFDIPARIYNQLVHLIYRRDPEKFQGNAKAFYTMVKNSQICRFHVHTKSLEQIWTKGVQQ